MKLLFKKLDPRATIPAFGGGDGLNAGLDLYACLPAHKQWVEIPIGGSAIIPTGIAWEPISGSRCAMIIQSRSGLGVTHGIECSNAGVVDSTYRGGIMLKLYNHGNAAYIINHGDRIAQGIVYLLPDIAGIEEVDELEPSVRGVAGFGSTGR